MEDGPSLPVLNFDAFGRSTMTEISEMNIQVSHLKMSCLKMVFDWARIPSGFDLSLWDSIERLGKS